MRFACSNIFLSVIIPTANRALLLQDSLESLLSGCADFEGTLECIVIDNGSTDNTAEVISSFSNRAPFDVRYFYAPCPGLHVGRNLGAQKAKGEILAYLDDDVIVQPGWAKGIWDSFQNDANLVLLGGPCRPLWEVDPPAWVEQFQIIVEDGYYYPHLSLIDFGEEKKEISGCYVFGCNFIVKKQLILDLGGFPPDGVPKSLLKYRGSGETTIAMCVDATHGMNVLYDPAVAVRHRVPASRLTSNYFINVSKRAGISSAFAQFRETRPLGKRKVIKRALLFGLGLASVCRLKNFKHLYSDNDSITPEECQPFFKGYLFFHYIRLAFSPILTRWALQERYFDDSPCPYWDSKDA